MTGTPKTCDHCGKPIQRSHYGDAPWLPRWVHVRANLSTYQHCERTSATPSGDPTGLRGRVERAQQLMR